MSDPRSNLEALGYKTEVLERPNDQHLRATKGAYFVEGLAPLASDAEPYWQAMHDHVTRMRAR